MSEPKRHHHLPQFYLNGFSKDGLVWVYDCDSERLRHDQPKNTAVIGHYYSFTEADGTKDNHIEKMLSYVEGIAQTVITKLEVDEAITEHDRAYFAFFLGLLVCRGPQYERVVNEATEMTLRIQARRIMGNPGFASKLLR